jgi:hypothetical protein
VKHAATSLCLEPVVYICSVPDSQNNNYQLLFFYFINDTKVREAIAEQSFLFPFPYT